MAAAGRGVAPHKVLGLRQSKTLGRCLYGQLFVRLARGGVRTEEMSRFGPPPGALNISKQRFPGAMTIAAGTRPAREDQP